MVMSDNGPQYSSELFTTFSQQYGLKHITSSPTYPQSNRAAERAVRTIKELLNKNQMKEGDMYLAMLVYRSTPLKMDRAQQSYLWIENSGLLYQ